MVREYSVPAVLCRAAHHMAGNTLSVSGMRRSQLPLMARLTLAVISLGGWHGLRMRIVTSSTPQLAFAIASACALRELLRVTDHFEGSWACASINGEDLLQPLTGAKVFEVFAGIEDALSNARQMALLADAVALGRR